MSRPLAFRESDVARALRGATKGGMKVRRIEIDPNGKIVLLLGAGVSEPSGDSWADVR